MTPIRLIATGAYFAVFSMTHDNAKSNVNQVDHIKSINNEFLCILWGFM